MQFTTTAAKLEVDDEGTVNLWQGFTRLALTRRQAEELYRAFGEAIEYSKKVAP